jgi:hypothetical protein
VPCFVCVVRNARPVGQCPVLPPIEARSNWNDLVMRLSTLLNLRLSGVWSDVVASRSSRHGM